MIYDWQQALWHKCLGQERLGHALLLYGMRGIGKLDFARELARAKLCENPTATREACGSCPACNWYAQESHPDFRLLEPENEGAEGAEQGKGGKHITVAQVRELSDFVNLTTHRNGFRVVIVAPAEAMNQAAANAILKTLEEPPPNTLFLLVTHQPQRLLPTIRSRCQSIAMPLPSLEQAVQWLASQQVQDPSLALNQAGGAPLEALALYAPEHQAQRQAFLARLATQPFKAVELAETAGSLHLPWVVAWLHKWVYDLLSVALCGRARYHTDFRDKLQVLAKQVNLLTLLRLQRELNEAQRLLQHPLNGQLVVEQLLLSYARSLS